MYSIFKASVPLAVIFFFCQIGFSVQQDECEAKFDDAEKCFQSLMIIGKQVKFTKETFQALCTTEFDAIACIQDYKTKCVKGMASMVFNLLSKKFNATFNNLCHNSDAMDEFLEHYNCLKDALMSDNAKLCTAQYQLRLEMIDQVEKDERFPIICCGFYELRQCAGDVLRAGCQNEKSIEYMNNMVTKFVGDLNKMFCSSWESLEVCRSNLPSSLSESFQKINAMDLATADSNKKFKSFLRLLKHLIEAAQH